jgi:hypothetical protein
MKIVTHYTARVVVERVSRTEPENSQDIQRIAQQGKERGVVELASIAIKGEDLAGVVDRLKGHLEIVEDFSE